MTLYSLDVLLFLFGTSLLFHVQFLLLLPDLHMVSQEAGQVVWHSHLFQNVPEFIVIHTVKGFGIVNKAEIDVFLELSCVFDDPVDVGNLISGSSTFSKTSLNIRKFMVHILLKPGLENFIIIINANQSYNEILIHTGQNENESESLRMIIIKKSTNNKC